MRVLFTVSGWQTHYAAMVPLGWALQAAGHEVRVGCPQSQADNVAHAGLVPVPLGDGPDVTLANRLQHYGQAVHGPWPYPWLPPHPVTGAPLDSLDDFDLDGFRRDVEPALAAQARHRFDAAVRFAADWRPDLVLHDPTSLDGLLAARVTGVPSALCLWGLPGTHEAEPARVVPRDVTGSFVRYGFGEFHPDMLEYVVDPCPASLAPPTTAGRLPVRYLPYSGGGQAPLWLLEPPARPRVCVAWSTALSAMFGPNTYLLPRLVHALADLDCEVFCTATAADVAALGEVPPSVRVLSRFPLSLLLPTCAAVVHHGGAGTAMTALWSGVPQLAVTFAAEQTVSGERIAAAGAGIHLFGHLADDAAIRAAVRDLVFTRGYRQRAQELRTELLARPTPADLVVRLEKLVS